MKAHIAKYSAFLAWVSFGTLALGVFSGYRVLVLVGIVSLGSLITMIDEPFAVVRKVPWTPRRRIIVWLILLMALVASAAFFYLRIFNEEPGALVRSAAVVSWGAYFGTIALPIFRQCRGRVQEVQRRGTL